MRKPFRCHLLSGGLLLTLLLAACGSGAASPSQTNTTSSAAASAAGSPPATKVKIGFQNVAAEVSLYLAEDHGYFKEQGIEAEFIRFRAGPDQIPQLANGQIDFGSGFSIDPSIFNAVAGNVPLKIIAPESSFFPTTKNAAMVVRQDHFDSGRYKSVADLKGMSIAANAVLGGTAQFLVERTLARGGLTANDVNLIPLGFADVNLAMTNKRLDAAWQAEPFFSQGVAQNIYKPVVYSGDLVPGNATWLGGLIAVSPVFAKAQPEVVSRFIVAQLKGQREYYQTVIRNQGSKDSIVATLIKYGIIKDAVGLETLVVELDPNDEMNPKDVQDQLNEYQDYFIRTGSVKQKLDVNQLVDSSYVNAAVQKLGRVQRQA